MLNPFRYGNPVPPQQFFGREREVQTVFSRLSHRESSAIVGQPHIGKSSFLRFLTEPEVCRRFDFDASRAIFRSFDVHLLGDQSTPAEFWSEVAAPLAELLPAPEIGRRIAQVQSGGYRSTALADLFNTIANGDRQVVLLIDEFDLLLHRPAFATAEFFGCLRSLATRTGGLSVVIASRLSISELHVRTESLSPTGSPFFNYCIDVLLRPLAPAEVDSLLDAALGSGSLKFTRADREFVIRLSGRHPFLLQAAASALFDSKQAAGRREEQYRAASAAMCERTRPFFNDLWRHLDPLAQSALVLLALQDAGSRQDGREFDTSDVERADWYAPELRRLLDLGLVESGPEGSWRIAAAVFVPWLTDDVIAGTRGTVDFTAWLRDREYDGLFTRKQKAQIKGLTAAVPKGVSSWVATFVGDLVKAHFKK